ncbi:hypothetical protein ACNQFN_08285 [Thauera butanivorans]|uniref:hypothetical protein n=1 Tax=Thauera butanivorans TaxID=86174 RepID=UPI003AB8059F
MSIRGIAMGAIGGLGRGISQNAQAAMAEEQKRRTRQWLADMERQIHAEREAAIVARRQKLMSSVPEDAGLSPRERAQMLKEKAIEANDLEFARHFDEFVRASKADERDAARADLDERKFQADQDYRNRTLSIQEQRLNQAGAERGLYERTTGMSGGAREAALRSELAAKVATGKANDAERAMFAQLQGRAATDAPTAGSSYTPTEVKKSDYWASNPQAAEREIERQIAALEMANPWLTPDQLEEMRPRIAAKLGITYQPRPSVGDQLKAMTDPLRAPQDRGADPLGLFR